jgi:Ca2+:H+ antiporter
VLGLAALGLGTPANPWLAVLDAVLLLAAVLAAVHHAETVAHALGEPYGTLILALAVTVIETALIVSIMLSEGAAAQSLTRDTVFATVMLVLNGIVGLCLLIGGGRHGEQSYTQTGVSTGLAMLSTLVVLTLVLPAYTVSAPGPVYSKTQLIFVAIVSLVVYAAFLLAQTVRHRDYFLHGPEQIDHAAPVGRTVLTGSFALMGGGLVAVVLLAKLLSPSLKQTVAAMGAPPAAVGIIIAAVVLLPEALAAIRAARQDRLQTSLNLALGSALATTGLTLPAVAGVSIALHLDLTLGLPAREAVLLALTLFVTSLSLSTGRTTVVHGILHLVLLATFFLVTLVP